MLKVNEKQLAAVTALPGEARYRHFIKVVADWEKVWGLYDDGWAMASTNDGTSVFLLWPAREYAQLCVSDSLWKGFTPKSFPLADLLDDLLPRFESSNTLAGIFFVPGKGGVTPQLEQLRADLDEALRQYE